MDNSRNQSKRNTSRFYNTTEIRGDSDYKRKMLKSSDQQRSK